MAVFPKNCASNNTPIRQTTCVLALQMQEGNLRIFYYKTSKGYRIVKGPLSCFASSLLTAMLAKLGYDFLNSTADLLSID